MISIYGGGARWRLRRETKMVKNFFDGQRVFDGGNDFQVPATVGTEGDINIEYPFKQPCPTDVRMSSVAPIPF